MELSKQLGIYKDFIGIRERAEGWILLEVCMSSIYSIRKRLRYESCRQLSLFMSVNAEVT